MRTLLVVFSILMVVGTSGAANADWGRPGWGPGGPGWGHGGPGWGHGPGWGPGGPGGPGWGHGPGWGPGGPGVPPPGGPGWGQPVPPPPSFQTQFVNCDSANYQMSYCPVNGYIMGAQVTQQRSFASCELGRSFGYQGNQLWVSDGCRATFAVQIRR
jgi:hypothetical protein